MLLPHCWGFRKAQMIGELRTIGELSKRDSGPGSASRGRLQTFPCTSTCPSQVSGRDFLGWSLCRVRDVCSQEMLGDVAQGGWLLAEGVCKSLNLSGADTGH